jgi:hypothetical protein
VCGNGVVEAGEECDPPGTGCTGTCQIDPDVCPEGVGTLTCGETVMGDSAAAGSTDVNMTYSCSPFGYSGNEVAYTFISPVATTVTFALGALTGDLDLFVLTGAPACATTTCVDGSFNAGTASESVTVAVAAGVPYYVVADGYAGATSTFTLTVTCGDGSCADPFPVDASGPMSVDIVVDTCPGGSDSTSPALGDCTAGGADGPDLVYRLDLGYAADVSLDLVDFDGSVAIDVVLYVRDVCTSGGLADAEGCSDDVGGMLRHGHLDLTLAAGSYYVIVDEWLYSDGTGTTYDCGNVWLNITTL